MTGEPLLSDRGLIVNPEPVEGVHAGMTLDERIAVADRRAALYAKRTNGDDMLQVLVNTYRGLATRLRKEKAERVGPLEGDGR